MGAHNNANPNLNPNPLTVYDDTSHQVVAVRGKNVTTDSTTGIVSGDMGIQVEASISPTANQRVNAQSGDFVDGAIVTLGTASDANTVNTVMGRLTKIRDLLLGFVFDNTDKLRASLYVKTSTAGDTVLTLGQGTMANSLPVAMSSDQSPKTTATPTRTSVTAAVSDTSLLASNTGRKGALFYNDSTAILYLAYGSGAATTTSYSTQVQANALFELPPEPIYTGAIRGIWSAANGAVRITELT